MTRAYLDHNATTPLRAEARAAMAAAMDVAGNPSSVHQEGRAARALVERARGQILAALGASACDLVFTSGATEAAALALAGRDLRAAPVEHDAVLAWCAPDLGCDAGGQVSVPDPARATLALASGETGIVQDLPAGLAVSDLTQAFGKIPFGFEWLGVGMGFVSAHKLGGPKGIGALILPQGTDLAAQIKGGGQEMGRRSGTENVVGIAGFAAAAMAAQQDLAAGLWQEVATRRDFFEALIEEGAPDTIFVGKGANRLPNTSCFATSGWKGETQVMAMDLAGFAVSAGSACASGKVRASGALLAMGLSEDQAASALRVSLGIKTTRDELARCAQAWLRQRKKRRARA